MQSPQSSASHRRRQSALVYSTSKLDGPVSPSTRLAPEQPSSSLINSSLSPSASPHINHSLQPPSTPGRGGSCNTNSSEESHRNSLGIWTGSKSAASTPNLVGNVARSPIADFSSSSITIASNNSTIHTQAQVQAGADSGASMDSQTSPSFQQRRKRSESTGGFKNTAGNITRIVKKSSSNFLRKLVKNFDDKDAPPIPTAQTSIIAASISSPSPRQPSSRSATLPDLPALASIAPGQTHLGPLSTPPPISPLMGQELVSQFADIGPPAQTTEPLNMYQHSAHNPNIESWLKSTASSGMVSNATSPRTMPPPSSFSPADLTASLAMLTHDDVECEDDEDDEGELDEDEDEDMPTNISNRLSRLYESGSLHLNQSQTSLYYSTKSYLSDSEAAELASRRASMAQDPLGYSLGLSRGNSIRFSQYSLASLHSSVAPIHHSTSPPSSPGLEGKSGPSRRPISLFLPLTTPADVECDDKTEVGEGESAGEVETEEIVVDDERELIEPLDQHELEQKQEHEQGSDGISTAELVASRTPTPNATIEQEAASLHDGPAIVCQSPLDVPHSAVSTLGRPLSTHSDQAQECIDVSVPMLEDEAAKKASILAAETARRLFDEDETLMKREEIAAYMATPNAFYRSILVHYMAYFDFSGLRLDMAFRALCQKLVLKGESQEVDRVLEAFAGRYVVCNPRTLLGGADHAKDVVHAITYSVLLLNTDLHVVRQSSLSKMSKSAFIKNTLQVVQQSNQDRPEESSSSRSVMSVDPVGLGLPRSLTAESSLEPVSPTGSKRRTPSVKSWKSGNSQQSTGPLGSNISAGTQHNNSKMGSDSRANGGYGNGKLWQHELEQLLKDMYTAVKQNQILLPVPPTPPVSSSRAGSRSNTSISSPPTSPVVSGFGSSFLSNRMSRLINPSSFSASSSNTQSFSSSQQQQQQHHHLQPMDSGLGMLGTSGNGGGFGLGISGRRNSVSARTKQLRNEAIQRLNAQAHSPDGAGDGDYVVVSPPTSHSATFGSNSQYIPNSGLAPSSRTNARYSVAASIYNEANVLNFANQHDRDLNLNRGPIRTALRGNEGQQSQFSSTSRLSTLTLNTSMSESTNTTTPSASLNSLASLQSLGTRTGVHPDDSSFKAEPQDYMFQDDDSMSIQEQKDLWHQHHLQTRYRMEGILWRKHLLERADKKAQHRAWRQLLVVLDQERGTLSMFRSDGSLPSIPAQAHSSSGSLAPPSTDSEPSVPLFDDIPLQHTITNILPPPGYSTSRRHVFALQLFSGAVYLFQTKTPQECESWARTCNYWASRTSKEPLVGGVVNMEYGWGRALDGVISALQAEESASLSSSGVEMVESPGPMRSQGSDYLNYPPPTTPTSSGPIDLSGRGRSASIKSGTRGSMSSSTGSNIVHVGSSMPPGDRITLFEWTAPMPAMNQSLLTEEEQMQALKRYVAGLESEMEVHQEYRVPMMRLFHPKSSNYAKAFNNWERRSRHLLKDMVKYQIYVECLEQSIQYQLLFLQQQRQRVIQLESDHHLHCLDQQLQRQSEEQSMLEAVERAGGGSAREHREKNVDLEAELEALVVREGPLRSWSNDGSVPT